MISRTWRIKSVFWFSLVGASVRLTTTGAGVGGLTGAGVGLTGARVAGAGVSSTGAPVAGAEVMGAPVMGASVVFVVFVSFNCDAASWKEARATRMVSVSFNDFIVGCKCIRVDRAVLSKLPVAASVCLAPSFSEYCARDDGGREGRQAGKCWIVHSQSAGIVRKAAQRGTEFAGRSSREPSLTSFTLSSSTTTSEKGASAPSECIF